MPSVLLVRHAQGSFGGADYDVLSDHGHAQTAALVQALRGRGTRVDRVVTGSLARQRDTAEPIAAACGCEVESDPRWDEYASEDILAHHSASDARLDRAGDDAPVLSSREFQQLLDGALHSWIDAGADGPADEPYAAFCARVQGALEALTGALGTGETAVAVTSGGPLAAICCALLRVPAATFVPFNRVVVNTGVTRVTHGRGGTNLVAFNEHGHLEHAGRSLVTYR